MRLMWVNAWQKGFKIYRLAADEMVISKNSHIVGLPTLNIYSDNQKRWADHKWSPYWVHDNVQCTKCIAHWGDNALHAML